MMNKNIYNRTALTPNSGQCFVYALNNGTITSVVAFINPILRAKKKLKERCLKQKMSDEPVDVNTFSELEKMIAASAVEPLHDVAPERTREVIEHELEGYQINADNPIRKLVWDDIDARDVAMLLAKC